MEKSALLQAMACHQTGDKPLPEPMMTQFTDIYVSIGLNELCLIYTNLLICFQSFKYISNNTQLYFQYILSVFFSITPTQVMVYHWWIPCETLVHTGSR